MSVMQSVSQPHLFVQCEMVKHFNALGIWFYENIFGEDVLGLTSDLRQDASWIEAVTHVPVSTIAADSSNPASCGPELQ